MSSPRTQSLGHGIRVDHRASCRSTHPRCKCPMSWFVPKSGGGRRRRTGFAGTLTQARQEKALETAEARQADPDPPEHMPEPEPTLTLFDFTKRLLRDTMPRKQITIDHYESAYRLRIHEHLGHLPLDEITPEIVRDWCDQLVRRDGDRTCSRKAAKTLRLLFNEAIAEGVLTHNPTAGMKFERRARSAVRGGAPSSEQHRQKKPALNRPQYEQLKRHAASVGLRELVMVRLLDD